MIVNKQGFLIGYFDKTALSPEELQDTQVNTESLPSRTKFKIYKFLTQLLHSDKNYKATLGLAKERMKHLDYDVPISSGLHRYKVSLPGIKDKDLESLGYFPSKVAVPERGQAQWTTWRGIKDNTHLHRHGKDTWYMHEDEYPSMQTLLKRMRSNSSKETADKTSNRAQELASILKATASGSRHALMEGVPGYVSYAEGIAGDVPTLKEADKYMQSKDYLLGKTVADLI